MKSVLALSVALLSIDFIESQNPVERVIHCNEKFTQGTHRNYSNYSGCLIEKRYEPEDC